MRKLSIILGIVALFMASVSSFIVADAQAQATLECYTGDCQVIPATSNQTTTVNTQTNQTTTSRTIESKSLIEKTRHYEDVMNVIVAINIRAQGVKSHKGCIDPVKRGWIKVGDPYTNGRRNGPDFTDSWEKGRKICNSKRSKCKKGAGGKKVCSQNGRKDDCYNGIKIRVKGPRIKKQTKKVLRFKSYKEFLAVYNKWTSTTNTTSSTTTPNVTVSYSCPTGWTEIVVNGQKMCQQCPKPECIPVCPEASVWNSVTQQCEKDGFYQDPPTTPGSPSNPTNPPSSGPGSQCKWDSAGVYNNHPHGSGDDVSPEDMAAAGGVCPTGSTDFS